MIGASIPCRECGSRLPRDVAPTREFCGVTCRVRAHRRRKAEEHAAFLAEAHDLFRRQTAAAIAQDAVAMTQVRAEADRLFRDRR